jgi:hypothetical protein
MEANESKFLTVKYDYEANEMHELSIKQNERLRLIDGSKVSTSAINDLVCIT